jgi:ArsR family transcriptional regulator, arsenate/arsenite/antimonite-responsive transcriptional repressor
MNAGELVEATGLSASRLSYHLRKLREAGLVTDSRDGTTIWYEPNLSMLDDTIVWLKQLQRDEAVSKASGYAKQSVTRDAAMLDSQKVTTRRVK